MWFTQEQKTDFNIVFFFFFSGGVGGGGYDYDNKHFLLTFFSLRSKRFRLVSDSEQKETVEGDFRFWSREKLNENEKMKEGGGGREGRKLLLDSPHELHQLSG